MLSTMRFHHIGIACFDIEVTAKYYTDAGYTMTDQVMDPIQNINISFLTKEGMPTLELLSPVDTQSPVCKILEKVGVSPYHVCYAVDDIAAAINALKKKKFIPLSHPVEACAMGNEKICFLFNKETGLIELVEEPYK